MEIELGRYFVNKSWRYLLPATKAYGEEFTERMESIWKLAAGIGDAYYNMEPDRRCIFILVDVFDSTNKNTLDTIEWLRNQEFFIDDYEFDTELEDHGRKRMIVIEFPVQYAESYDHFLKGEYSQMYNEKDIMKFFTGKSHEKTLNILMRKDIAFDTFIRNMEHSFGELKVTKKDLIGNELDFPPEWKKEIFNYGDE